MSDEINRLLRASAIQHLAIAANVSVKVAKFALDEYGDFATAWWECQQGKISPAERKLAQKLSEQAAEIQRLRCWSYCPYCGNKGARPYLPTMHEEGCPGAEK